MRLKRNQWIVVAVLLAVVAAGWWLRPRQRWNVLFITLDTTRANRLGCYGYKKALTPALDQLASEGVLYEHAYAPVPLTLPSHASMFTGLYPPEHGVRVNGRESLPAGIPNLASLLAEQGYATGAFVSAFPLDRKFGLQRGFQVYSDELNDVKIDKGRQLRDAVSVTDASINWMQKNVTSSFFCWVHFYDPHHPYLQHSAEFGDQFKEGPYDAEIAYIDRQIKRLRDFLDEQGMLENTLIVVVGDHGESLGEHQERRHGNMVYGSTLHVPMLMRLPDAPVKNRRVTAAASLVDLLPTILDVMKLPAVERISGISRAPELISVKQGSGEVPARLIYGESLEPQVFRGWSPLQCLIDGKWKYIRTKQPELYDLEKDPGELQNLAAAERDKVSELEERLAAVEKRFVHWDAKPALLSAGDIGKLSAIGYAFVPKRGTDETGSGQPASAGRDVKEMIGFANTTEDAEGLVDTNPKQAEVLARQVIEKEPSFDGAWIALGQALENQKKVDEAQKSYLKALEIDPGAYMANFHLGNICLNKGDLTQAVARFEQALKFRPDAASIHANLGNTLLLQGKLTPGVQHLQTAVELHPGSMSVRLSLAEGLTQAGQIDAAMAEVEGVLKLDPHSPGAHGQLGMLYFRKGNNEEGFKHLRRSLLLEPKDALMRYNLAVALEGIGRTEEAIQEYERSLNLNPNDPVTKKGLEGARKTLQRKRP